jgi:hypothetical protein
MLTKEQRIEIGCLKEEGVNVSEISKKMHLDWKTVKRCISQHSKDSMGAPLRNNNQPDENELTKAIFRKLNAGIPPEKIVEEDGHVDLVTSLYEKRKNLRGLNKSDFSLPDPQIVESFKAWEKSFEKYYDWHFGRAIRVIGKAAYQKMILCANYMNKAVGCFQIESYDPYNCVGCAFYSGGGFVI